MNRKTVLPRRPRTVHPAERTPVDPAQFASSRDHPPLESGDAGLCIRTSASSAVRAWMARRGLGGPVGSFLFLNLRLLNDQSLENATGVGAPPWTWPRDEQAIDLVHKAVYAFVAGAVADRLVGDSRAGGRQKGGHWR